MPLNAPAAADTPETFADVIKVIETMNGLSKSRRRDLISALKSMARFFGKFPEEIPANTNWLRQRLRQFHPRHAGVSEKYLANLRSAVVAALRMTGANSTRTACQPTMSDQFATLYDAVPDKLLAYKLSRFFRWCSEQVLAPGEIGDKTVEEFEAAVTKETLHRNPSKVARDAVLTWNKMRYCVAGWPDIALTRTSSRVHWTLPLDMFPAAFQADVEG